ncbi:MAG TPA: hypothetical protein VMX54_01035 [Vicinamibacteria bacterium]|nr:hypothetical protein [Vicinamibacteria bacterium]
MNDDPRRRHRSGPSGPVTIGGFAGFGFGVFWYAWAKVGFWKALLYGIFWIPWLGYRVAEALRLGQ